MKHKEPTMAEARELREGDIYHWRWADEKRDADRGPWGSYHCKSQWAVVHNGRLFDTYWSVPSYEHELRLSDVCLTFVANYADLEKVHETDARYYRREDIVDMRHPNSTREPIYRRKAAKRDEDAIRAELAYLIGRSKDEVRRATERLQDLERQEALISDGRLDEVYLPWLA